MLIHGYARAGALYRLFMTDTEVMGMPQQKKGQLKIFFSYAESIGKSYDDFKKEMGDQAKVYFENEVVTEALIELLKKENTIA